MPEHYLAEEKVKILEDQFRKDKYIRGEELMGRLEKATGLKAGQIGPWFSRERGKRKREEEKDELQKKIADKDAEIRGLRDQIAALQVQNATQQQQLENLPSWGDILPLAKEGKIAELEALLNEKDAEIESLKASAGMKDDAETQAKWLEELVADSMLELEQQTAFPAMVSGWDLSQDGP